MPHPIPEMSRIFQLAPASPPPGVQNTPRIGCKAATSVPRPPKRVPAVAQKPCAARGRPGLGAPEIGRERPRIGWPHKLFANICNRRCTDDDLQNEKGKGRAFCGKIVSSARARLS